MNNNYQDLNIWRNYIKSFIQDKVFPKIKDSDSILDIGSGVSTDIIKNKFPNVKTLDKNGKRENSLNPANVISDYKGDILDENISNILPKFDIIFLMEVLEHVETPWTVEKNIKSILNIEGLFIVSVPSFLWWHPLAGVYEDYWRFLPGHIPHLFPNMEIVFETTEKSNTAKPLGMCYILKNKNE